MMPSIVTEQAPVPPPAYHRAQARLRPALHIDALTLVRTLHLLREPLLEEESSLSAKAHELRNEIIEELIS